MEEKENRDRFLIILLVFFVIFLIIYISKQSGLYEYKAYNKSILTKENIKKFEKDVEEGKNVSINDYLVNSYKDYSNTITDMGYNFGKLVESVMNNGIKKTLKMLSALFYEKHWSTFCISSS